MRKSRWFQVIGPSVLILTGVGKCLVLTPLFPATYSSIVSGEVSSLGYLSPNSKCWPGLLRSSLLRLGVGSNSPNSSYRKVVNHGCIYDCNLSDRHCHRRYWRCGSREDYGFCCPDGLPEDFRHGRSRLIIRRSGGVSPPVYHERWRPSFVGFRSCPDHLV